MTDWAILPASGNAVAAAADRRRQRRLCPIFGQNYRQSLPVRMKLWLQSKWHRRFVRY